MKCDIIFAKVLIFFVECNPHKYSHAAQSSTNGSISHIQIDRDILESDRGTKVLGGRVGRK